VVELPALDHLVAPGVEVDQMALALVGLERQDKETAEVRGITRHQTILVEVEVGKVLLAHHQDLVTTRVTGGLDHHQQ
jgi:hypothetical protein